MSLVAVDCDRANARVIAFALLIIALCCDYLTHSCGGETEVRVYHEPRRGEQQAHHLFPSRGAQERDGALLRGGRGRGIR